MGAPRAPYMAKTDKERLATGFWNRIESNQATDCNSQKSTEGLSNVHNPGLQVARTAKCNRP